MFFQKLVITAYVLLLIVAQPSAIAQSPCLRLKGVVVDYLTREPLTDAQVFSGGQAGQLPIGATDASGCFSATVACTANQIRVQKADYRSQLLAIDAVSMSGTDRKVALLIPLIPLEKPGDNRAYLQQMQTSYVLTTDSWHSPDSTAQPVQYGQFSVRDALRNTPVSTKLCLIYTKTGKRECVNTDANGQVSIPFRQADIVALETEAKGYQRYDGNLVVEALDGRTQPYPVLLQPTLALLTVFAREATACALSSGSKTYSLESIPGHPDWYCTYQALPQSYQLRITYAGKTVRQPVQLREGLNVIMAAPNVRQTPKPIVQSRDSLLVSARSGQSLPRLDSLPPLYFQQSSYQLRPESQKLLRQVARHLDQHRNHKVEIMGHTDNVGDKQLNKNLSDFRAKTVASFLAKLGVLDEQCLEKGVGSQYPIAPNDTEENKALNRRVSLKLITD
jgi:outer membrane protein OmpA-like peptidoglycan-associated protein